MKKNNQRGFMLVETLVVSTFIMGTLVFLFAQFRSINLSYQKSFQYNSASAVLAAENFKKFYVQDNFPEATLSYREQKLKYLDLSSCPSEYIKNVAYCNYLLETLDVKKVYLIDADLSYIESELENEESEFAPSTKQFIKSLTNDELGTLLKYRLIVQLNDESYGTVKINEIAF